MKILLIRHGKTKGNLKNRYIGTTDEPLCAQGFEELKKSRVWQNVPCVYVSPLRRCLETADLLFPGARQEIVSDLRECDFGMFENKNYLELSKNPAYQAWVDSGGTLPFPGGESREAFQARCVDAFCKILCQARQEGFETIGIVAHGGTVMSIMSGVVAPERDYYDFQVKNGCGYEIFTADGMGERRFSYCGIEFVEGEKLL